MYQQLSKAKHLLGRKAPRENVTAGFTFIYNNILTSLQKVLLLKMYDTQFGDRFNIKNDIRGHAFLTFSPY